MPATIQKILKPTKYRAVDTAPNNLYSSNLANDFTNVSFDSFSFVDGVLTLTATGSDVENVAITNPVDVTAGDEFLVSFTISSGGGSGVYFKLSPNSDLNSADFTTDALSDGTHGFTMSSSSLTDSTSYFGFRSNASHNGTLVITDISIQKIGNNGNNHGQIYSGRGLEFDGVSDNLLVHADEADALFGSYLKTFACWINIDAIGSEQIIAGAWLSRRSIGIDSSGYLATCSTNGDDDVKATTKLEANTWYRIVVVSNIDQTDDSAVDTAYADNFSHYDFYINGVLQEKAAANLFKTSLYTTLGARYNSGVYGVYFQGKLSDAQGWSEKWSASDALYDYLNPESLALSNSSTSLTESNLKVWYPMQDGHRGQQSYIFDGANTGLGEELATNADMNPDGGGWRFNNRWESGGNPDGTSGALNDVLVSTTFPYNDVDDEDCFYTTFDGKQVLYLKTLNSGGNELVDQSPAVVAGTTYKFHIRVWVIQGQLRVWQSNNNFQNDIFQLSSTTGQWEDVIGYLTCDVSGNAGLNVGTTNGLSVECYIDSVSMKPVNDKHHATTVFLGDEQIDEQDNRDFSGSDNDWVGGTVNGSNTNNDFATYDENTTSGATEGTYFSDPYLKVISDDDASNVQYAKLDGAYWETFNGGMVVGRTYRLSYSVEITTATKGTLSIGFAQADATATIDEANDRVYNSTQSATTHTIDFVYAGTTTHAQLVIKASTESVFEAYFDNFSLKEVGVATGWTDADQQLDIPQTALQSYNQLAWFNSENQDATEDSIGFTDGSSDLNFQATNWSASFWLYVFDDNAAGDANLGGYVMSKGTYDTSGWYIFCETGGYLRLYTPQSGDNDYAQSPVIPKGEWAHCVVTVGSSGTSAKWYVNGELGTTTTIDAATSNTDNFNLMNRLAATNALGGSINEISMWNKVLSQSEVNELYNSGKALDAKTHSASTNLLHYWRNNGLAEWTDLGNATTLYNGTPNQITETLLLPAGVDSSRDTQGFIMNRQKDTNSLNLPNVDTIGNYVIVPGGSAIDDIWSGGGSFTAWIYPKGIGDGDYGRIFDKGGSTYCHLSSELNETSKLVYTTKFSSSGTCGFTTDARDIKFNEWNFVAVTYNSSAEANAALIYIFNSGGNTCVANTASETRSGSYTSEANKNLYIGNDGFVVPNERQFDGLIDDLLFYSDILTALESDGSAAEAGDTITGGEILRIYNAGKRSHR